MNWRIGNRKILRYSNVYLIFIILGLPLFDNVNLTNIRNQNIVKTLTTSENQNTIFTQNDGNSTLDSGNNFTNAMSIDFGTYICSMPDGDAHDYYKIYIPILTSITIEIAGEADTNFDLILYDTNELPIANNTNDYSIESIILNIYDAGTYYIHVLKRSGSGIYYLVTRSDITETYYYTDTNITKSPDNTMGNWLVPTILVFIVIIGIVVGVTQVIKRTRDKKKVKIVYTKKEKVKFEELQENDLQGYSFGYEKDS